MLGSTNLFWKVCIFSGCLAFFILMAEAFFLVVGVDGAWLRWTVGISVACMFAGSVWGIFDWQSSQNYHENTTVGLVCGLLYLVALLFPVLLAYSPAPVNTLRLIPLFLGDALLLARFYITYRGALRYNAQMWQVKPPEPQTNIRPA